MTDRRGRHSLRFCFERLGKGGEGHGVVREATATKLAQGSGNAVYAFPSAGATPSVLRLSLPDAYSGAHGPLELGLMRLFAHLGLHAALEAASVDAHSLRVVMPRLTGLSEHLRRLQVTHPTPTSRFRHLAKLARQLVAVLCEAASLGLCILDVKPGNFLYEDRSQRVYIIDLEPEHVSYLDADLLALAKEGPSRCRRAKGVMLYVMLLLLYRQLLNPSEHLPKARRELASLVRATLARSCVPWEELASLPGAEDRTTLAYKLGLISQGYFYKTASKEEAIAELLQSGRELSRRRCDAGQIVVDGVDYDVGERCRAPYDLRTFGARSSPCEPDGAAIRVVGSEVSDQAGAPLLPSLGHVAVMDASSACPLLQSSSPHHAPSWTSLHHGSSSPTSSLYTMHQRS